MIFFQPHFKQPNQPNQPNPLLGDIMDKYNRHRRMYSAKKPKIKPVLCLDCNYWDIINSECLQGEKHAAKNGKCLYKLITEEKSWKYKE